MINFLFRIVVIVAALAPLATRAEAPLTLAAAERLALEHAPWYAHHRTNVEAAAERAVYEGRLPDPQLTIGAINVPTDSFSLRDEDMSMLMVGVRQSFPPGDTTKLRTRRAEQQVSREQAKLELERRNLLREVRRIWFELWSTDRESALLAEQERLAARGLEAAQGRFRAAQESERMVARARQAVARLAEREPMLRAKSVQLRARLTRYISNAAQMPLAEALPELPKPGTFEPERHPESLAAAADVEGMRAEVAMARAEYKPGVMLDVQYGFRRDDPAGMDRPDMLTAMVTFDLPVFREKRQDRRLAESQTRETAARLEAEDKRREVAAMYESARAEHRATEDRLRVYEEQLLPAIRSEAGSTSGGFAREQNELREARGKELDARIELVRLRALLGASHAELLYLTGEPSP